MRKCLEVNQGVMLIMALGGLPRDPPGRKEGRRVMKIGSMRRKGSLVLEKSRFKHTGFKRIGKCPVLRGVIVSTEGMKSLSERMRNLNISVG